jgi:hypothetical protein
VWKVDADAGGWGIVVAGIEVARMFMELVPSSHGWSQDYMYDCKESPVEKHWGGQNAL